MIALSPRGRGRSRSQDLIKTVLAICSLLLVNLSLSNLTYLRQVLDSDAILALHYEPPLFSLSRPKRSVKAMQNLCRISPVLGVNASHVTSHRDKVEQPAAPCGELRRHWSQNELQSDLAKRLRVHQLNCSMPAMTFHVDNLYGMGSHFVQWSQALCNAWEAGHRLRTYNPDWLWLDQKSCSREGAARNPFSCYLPSQDLPCRLDASSILYNVSDVRDNRKRCARVRDAAALSEFRAASTELLFENVSPLVINEARRQVGLLFGGRVPDELVTVHIRWGDKFFEMDLRSIDEYVQAVQRILQMRNLSDSNAHIYVATEDPRAAKEFARAAPLGWKLYVDRTIVEMDEFRPSKGNRASWTARNTKGRAGLVALGSMLVALEATSFVLTTQSNWSRVMNHLRTNVINPRCYNCTLMIDLRPGEW